MPDPRFRGPATDTNVSWVRRDSGLSYLSRDAPDSKVTYDMSVTPMGVVKVAPFGTRPMAIVDGTAPSERAADVPTAPMGTATTLLVIAVIVGAALWVLKPRDA